MCHFTFVIRSINECCLSCFQVKQRSCSSLIINDQHELDFKVATTLLLLGFMRFCRLCVICKSRSKRKVRRSIAFLSKRRGDHLNSTEIQACLWRNRKMKLEMFLVVSLWCSADSGPEIFGFGFSFWTKFGFGFDRFFKF